MNPSLLRGWRAIGAAALLLLPVGLFAQTNGARQDDSRQDGQINRPTVESLGSESDLVVVGRVVSSSSRWVGKKIITTSEVQSLESLKGKAPGPTLQVATLGGTVGVIRQTATHFPTLEEGEVAILFLGQVAPEGASAPGSYRILHQAGKVRLLNPGEPDSRLENNRRLQDFLGEVKSRVRKGGR